jgi:ankyrin repeat protein
LRALLSEQIDLEARDAAGRTALLLAVLRNEAPSVEALLAAGADPNSAAADGTTPLEAAETAHETSIAAALRRAGAR